MDAKEQNLGQALLETPFLKANYFPVWRDGGGTETKALGRGRGGSQQRCSPPPAERKSWVNYCGGY